MLKTRTATLLLLTLLSAPAAAHAQDVKAVIDEASRAMGITGLNAITYSGTSAIGNFGQSRTISFGLASTVVRNYTRTIDFTVPASHATGDSIPPAVAGAPPPQQGRYDQSIT